jgi:hypothetical protein
LGNNDLGPYYGNGPSNESSDKSEGEMEDTNTDDIKRQAVVIIHGIGEQRPMDTLRGFVNALLHEENQHEDEKKGRPYHSKPDTISNSYEMRRIKLRKFKDPRTVISINDDWKYQTDFFEYYWAHHMSGTEWRHVLTWIQRILRRSWRDLTRKDRENSKRKAYENPRCHQRLGLLYAWTWAFIIVAFVVSSVFAIMTRSTPVVTTTGVPAILFALIVAFKFLPRLFLGEMAKNTIGDAARYLDIAPANIARRYDILRGGKEMLRSLHEQTSTYTEKDEVRYVYDRIVVVGHSLGSIIAYDLLKHYWAEVNGHLQIEHGKALEVAESFDCPDACPDIGKTRHLNHRLFWKAQYNLWRDLNRGWLGKEAFESDKAHRARWLITDFITLGSPLSYGALLLADSVDDFKTRTELRELPICPPDRSRHIRPGHFVVPLDQEADVSASKLFDILHHGALFAVTRWTNFFFPKDLIAGKVKNVFGEGIRDIELIGGPDSWVGSHTSYWDLKSTTCLEALRTILKDVRWSEPMVAPVSVGKSEAVPRSGRGRR